MAEETSEEVSEFIFNAISSSTRRTYATAQRSFTAWCLANALEPLPMSHTSVANFLARQAQPDLDKASGTIAVMRSALSTMHEESRWGGYPNPCDHPHVVRMMTGVKKSKVESDAAKRAAATPTSVVTPRFLVEHEAWFGIGAADPDDVMMWAAVCLGTFGALRKTELLGSSFYPERRLLLSQITFHGTNAGHTELAFPASHDDECISHISVKFGVTKADPLARNPPHLIYSAVAIRAMWRWVNMRCTLQRADVPQLFFSLNSRKHLEFPQLTAYVVGLHEKAGMQKPKITGKAFRKGAASELVASGIPNSVGADLGRWKSASMVDTYATPAAKAARYAKMSRELGL